MLIFENFSQALLAIKANKSRAILTMLGIIIGIASVIAIMTVGNSISNAMAEQMGSRGVNNITVGLSRKDDDGWGYGFFGGFDGPKRDMNKEDYINNERIEKLSEEFADRISGVSLSESVGNGKVSVGGKYANVAVTGVNKTAFESGDLTLLKGRDFYDSDYSDGKKVCLVSDYFCNNLYRGNVADAIEKKVRVKVDNKLCDYVIIGVYQYDANQAMFATSKYDTTTSLYIPLNAALEKTHNSKGYSQITVVAKDTSDVTNLSSEIAEYLNQKFYRNNNNYEVSCFATQSIIEEYSKTMKMISIAISVIASISLLVGGVGVMNIMLVSITERTREIGTRKALGATNASIRLQFVIESIVLCSVGGVFGVIVGIIVGIVAAKNMGYAGTAPMGSIIFSLVFSMAIGIFFGYYPANKAAKMNPIDALRYE